MIPVNVIEGNDDTFNHLCYGQKHPGTLQYLQNQFSNFQQTLSHAGQQFVSSAKEIFDQYNSSEALRAARLALNKVSNIFTPDNIRYLYQPQDLQTAQPTMQRWIMAEPTIRSLFHNQRCDGYSNSYVDVSPGIVGDLHYDYQRVMNGMVCTDDAKPDEDFRITHYYDEIPDGDRELTIDEQVDILNTWDVVRAMIKRGKEDPTNSFGGNL